MTNSPPFRKLLTVLGGCSLEVSGLEVVLLAIMLDVAGNRILLKNTVLCNVGDGLKIERGRRNAVLLCNIESRLKIESCPRRSADVLDIMLKVNWK